MSMKNHESVEELLNAPEGEHYQFKEAKSRFDFAEAVKYCCALSNCGGGKFVLGITDIRPRKVIGSEAFEQPERTRKGLIDKLHVRVDFQLYEHEAKRVLVFEIAGRPTGLPVQVDGIAWWYVSDSLVPMPQEVMRDIYFEAGHDFSSDVCPSATIQDLDANAIEAFRAAWIEKRGNDRVREPLHNCAPPEKDLRFAKRFRARILYFRRFGTIFFIPFRVRLPVSRIMIPHGADKICNFCVKY